MVQGKFTLNLGEEGQLEWKEKELREKELREKDLR